jgi:hypothetical protein
MTMFGRVLGFAAAAQATVIEKTTTKTIGKTL